MKLTLSSKKAAHYFNVNESTIKRWADSGILNCYKTAGGHRKFDLNDLKKHAELNNFQTTNLLFVEKELNNKTEIRKRNYNSLSKKLEKFILKGDREKTYEFLYTLYLNEYTLEEIFDKIIKDTMRQIGRNWADKNLSIESEHIATNILISSLHQLEQVILKKKKIKKTAICAGLENEFHEIGLLCIKITLEADGWNVIYPGVNLPVNSLIELISKYKPDLLCISSTYSTDNKEYEIQLYELEKICNLSGIQLLLGGENILTKKTKESKCDSISELKAKLKKN